MPPAETSPRQKPRARRPGRIVGAAALAASLVTAAGASVQLLQGAEPRSSRRVDAALDDVFAETGVDRGELSGRVTADDVELTLTVPDGESYARMNAEITSAVRSAGASVLEAVERGRDPDSPDLLEMTLGSDEGVTHRVRLQGARTADPVEEQTPGPARIALVFDDLGYATDGLARELLELPATVTFAVLPGLRASRAFAESASARGHEVILHLPLEPVDSARHDPGPDALLVDLDGAEKRRRLGAFFDGLPAYRGVSNHMGSRFSSDPGSVAWLLREVRRRDQSLFFLDSKTTPYSVIPEQARAIGVRCLSNNLFLDGIEPSRIDPSVQTRRLRGIAERRGQAVGIGHVRRETIDAVRAAIPRWESDGIRLVGLSELVHPEGQSGGT